MRTAIERVKVNECTGGVMSERIKQTEAGNGGKSTYQSNCKLASTHTVYHHRLIRSSLEYEVADFFELPIIATACSRAVDSGPGTSRPRQFVGAATGFRMRSHIDWEADPAPWQCRELSHG
jgi:hypothetical protein